MAAGPAKLNAFPVFMRVKARRVVIVGGGEEALAKARLMAQSSAELIVISAAPEPALIEWAAANQAQLVQEPYRKAFLEGAALVFAATGEEEADCAVVADARSLAVPVNAVDRPELCDFFPPALVNRAPVAVAVGTEGAGPVLAQIIRAQID